MKTDQPCPPFCNSATWTDQNGTVLDFSLMTKNQFILPVTAYPNNSCIFQSNSTFIAANCDVYLPYLCQKQCRLKGNFEKFHLILQNYLLENNSIVCEEKIDT